MSVEVEMTWKAIANTLIAKLTSTQAFVGGIICYIIHRLTETNTAALEALKGHNGNLMKSLEEREARIIAMLDKHGSAHKKKEEQKS